MEKVDLIGTSLLVLVVAGSALYFFGMLTFWRFQRERTFGWLWSASRWILIGYGGMIGLVGVVGSIYWVYPGLWGPAALLFAGVWTVIRDIGPGAKLPYNFAPLYDGFRIGERLVLLGGAAGTLIAYVRILEP